MMRILAACAASVLLLVACTSRESEAQSEAAPPTGAIDSTGGAQWKLERLTQQERDCEGEDCSYVRLHIPRIVSLDKLSEGRINSYIDELIKSTIQSSLPEPIPTATLAELSQGFLQSHELAQVENPGSQGQWYLEILGDSSLLTPHYFTLVLEYATYTGGAHGAHFYKLQTFDLQSGKPLDMARWIDLPRLTQRAEIAFRKHWDLSTNASLNDAGFWFENNNFTLPENMALTPEGILLLYNQYEVASYAQGGTKLVIPYSGLLLPGAPIAESI